MAKKPPTLKSVESLKHDEAKRKNIPSAEQQSFIQKEQAAPKMTRWWNDICAKIEARDFHQWSDIANVLLSVSLEDQEAMGRKFKQIRVVVPAK